MQNMFPDEAEHLRDYCADSILLRVLLINGYGFSNLSFPHISFQGKVSPHEDSSICSFRRIICCEANVNM